jgi:hypothetical protein
MCDAALPFPADVDTTVAVKNPRSNDWDNEIHPRRRGYAKLARWWLGRSNV